MNRVLVVGCVVCWSLCLGQRVGVAAEPARLSFNEHIKPILANHCWSCHGPDETTREGGLRLDQRSAAVGKATSGLSAIVPGNLAASELVKRIETTDSEAVMPPPSAKKPLNAAQKELLKRWIDQGAEFAPHWAFQTPQRPTVPTVHDARWNAHPIDAFVSQRLSAEGLKPTDEASPAEWLRRVTFDLTGLPPTVDELRGLQSELQAGQGAASDVRSRVYAGVVDRLLKSPRHAERMAMLWLDAARYADTNGYNNDETRTMWPWRDWVIDAFANDMPYDRFLTEQLAGDLLPNATLSQKVATGFNRNHVLTTEGGIIEEEYHVEYVADRVHTTATVFLGLSMQCARCHEHKYDPLTQRDYYRFAAFFNNVPDKVVPYSQGRMAEPLLKVPSREQLAELAELDRNQTELDAALKARAEKLDAEVAQWEKSLRPEDIAKAGPVGLLAHFAFEEKAGTQVVDVLDDNRRGAINGKVERVAGKVGSALKFDGHTYVDAGQVGSFEADEKFSIAVWINPSSASPTTVLSKMDDANAHRGYDVIMEGAKVATHFVHQFPNAAFKVVTKSAVSLNEWHHLVVTYDGTKRATGLKIYVDGKDQPLDVTTNNSLTGTLKTDKPFHIGKRQSSVPFQGLIDEVQLYGTVLTAEEVARLTSGQSLGRLKEILALAADQRSPEQRAQLKRYFAEQVDEVSKKLRGELSELPRRREAIDKAVPVTMVMAEMPNVRPTFMLKRGQYDQRGDVVTAGVPSALSNMSFEIPGSRLGLAQWLTDPAHPLTARVAVNRWWEMLFGTGLVETTEDFGVQGAVPSHPELLDWLATELIRTKWSQRELLKQIVLSATYRQSSSVGRSTSATAMTRDPRNRLLWHGPRYRLPAETVRDNALFVSGLMKERIGGPSVRPYQPEGLWEDVSVERREKYVPDAGDGLYRRSMYTFWKRTCPPPTMSTFDAPDRETCVIRRARTNTPLQALVLLNDPTYVEAARNLAERLIKSASTDEARLTLAFQTVLTREPQAAERAVLMTALQTGLKHFGTNVTAAEQLVSVGRSERDRSLDVKTHAAWTTVASMLLNLDETISKR